MDTEQLKSIFDRQAPSYDQQWSRLAAFRDGLHLLIGSVFAPLPARARILCVGAGTGAEFLYLAGRFPGWTFTAVEPSSGMLDVCRELARERGIDDRCTFHEGFLETLPDSGKFDAATCLLVSQFILDAAARTGFFRGIAERLRPGGLLASSDLSFDVTSDRYPGLLDVWLRTMAMADIDAEGLERMRAAYRSDVSILSAGDIEAMLESAGFESPVPFFQAGLIRAWYARRAGGADTR